MKKILTLIPRIGLIIVFTITAVVSLGIGYIVFAPDTWPKPFYLVYDAAGSAEEGGAASSKGPAEGHAAGTEPAEESAALKTSLEIRPGQGVMLDTGSKIVNLMDPTGRKYLRAGIVLEFVPHDLAFYTMEGEARTAYVEAFREEINAKLPVINDIIITLLSNQTFENVYTAEGKEALRKQVMEKINQQIPEYRVIFVYFTEFVVQ